MIAESLRILTGSQGIGFGLVRVAAVSLASSLALGCAGGVTPDAQAIRDARDTGAKVPPTTTLERQVLEQLEKLPPDQPRKMGSTTVVAGQGYDAASGRFCRTVTFSPKTADPPVARLACREAAEWFFVPDVLAASAGARTPPPSDGGPASER